MKLLTKPIITFAFALALAACVARSVGPAAPAMPAAPAPTIAVSTGAVAAPKPTPISWCSERLHVRQCEIDGRLYVVSHGPGSNKAELAAAIEKVRMLADPSEHEFSNNADFIEYIASADALWRITEFADPAKRNGVDEYGEMFARMYSGHAMVGKMYCDYGLTNALLSVRVGLVGGSGMNQITLVCSKVDPLSVTPAPTATPIPTATPLPTATISARQRYFNDMNRQAVGMQFAISDTLYFIDPRGLASYQRELGGGGLHWKLVEGTALFSGLRENQAVVVITSMSGDNEIEVLIESNGYVTKAVAAIGRDGRPVSVAMSLQGN